MKDDSLLINTLESNNYLCHIQNSVNFFSKIVNHFSQKAKNFVYFVTYDFDQLSPACGPNTYGIIYEET